MKIFTIFDKYHIVETKRGKGYKSMKDSQPQKSDVFDVFIMGLKTADFVRLDTVNALGEMDSHSFPAASVLSALNKRKDIC